MIYIIRLSIVWKIMLINKCGLKDHRDEVLYDIIVCGSDNLLSIDTNLYNACIFIQGYDYCFKELFRMVLTLKFIKIYLCLSKIISY